MSFLFDDPFPLVRTVVVGTLAYLGLIVLLRVSGKRTLAQMNAFDFIVTVALGSTLATILLSREVTLAQGLTAFFVLVALQFVITWTSVRSVMVARLAKAEPAALVYRGRILEDAARRERVVREELEAAIREAGLSRTEDADLVVLETDGTFSVIGRLSDPGSAITTVSGVPRGAPEA